MLFLVNHYRLGSVPLLPCAAPCGGDRATACGVSSGVLAPWIGHAAEAWGRRPVLLAGFALEPLRAILFAFFTNSYWLPAIQVIDGITGATITVMTILVLTDLTAGAGRFNFVRGTVGALTGVAASVSTTATGFISARFGESTGFLGMAVVAATGAVILWLWMPESRPKEYTD